MTDHTSNEYKKASNNQDGSTAKITSNLTSDNKLQCQDETINKFTPAEIIDYLGFGRAQLIVCAILSLADMGGYCSMQLQPYLSARLYVEMQLSPYSEALLGFVTLAGSMFSALPVGIVSDKIGRKKANILVCCFITFWNLITCAAPNFTWIVICRLLTALCRGTVNTSSVYFREFFPQNKVWLGLFVGQHIAGTIFGESFAIIAAYFLLTNQNISWKYYVTVMSSPMIIAILLVTFFIEETPEFLVSKGRNDQAVEVVEKIARQNRKGLPGDFSLGQRKNLTELKEETNQDELNQNYWRLFLSVMKNGNTFKVFVLIVLIGSGAKIITDGLSYILTDLLFLEGQSGNYCQGTEEKSYYISKTDYLKLLAMQISSIMTAIISFPILKRQICLKYQSLFCFSIAVILVSSLYFCPNLYIAFAFLSIIRILMQMMTISTTLAFVQFEVPAKIRGLIVGLGMVLRNVLLSSVTFFNQALSKKSQHYVTSLTLFAMILGLVSAVLIPKIITGAKDENILEMKIDKIDDTKT